MRGQGHQAVPGTAAQGSVWQQQIAGVAPALLGIEAGKKKEFAWELQHSWQVIHLACHCI